jgi:hypothetical protein
MNKMIYISLLFSTIFLSCTKKCNIEELIQNDKIDTCCYLKNRIKDCDKSIEYLKSEIQPKTYNFESIYFSFKKIKKDTLSSINQMSYLINLNCFINKPLKEVEEIFVGKGNMKEFLIHDQIYRDFEFKHGRNPTLKFISGGTYKYSIILAYDDTKIIRYAYYLQN